MATRVDGVRPGSIGLQVPLRRGGIWRRYFCKITQLSRAT
jgi:hypothetical protein